MLIVLGSCNPRNIICTDDRIHIAPFLSHVLSISQTFHNILFTDKKLNRREILRKGNWSN